MISLGQARCWHFCEAFQISFVFVCFCCFLPQIENLLRNVVFLLWRVQLQSIKRCVSQSPRLDGEKFWSRDWQVKGDICGFFQVAGVVSPPFISRKKATWKGSHNPTYGTKLVTSMIILQVGGWFKYGGNVHPENSQNDPN